MSETPLQTLERLRPNYPTPMSPEENGRFINEVCWTQREAGYGMLKKNPGQTHAVLPNGALVARDVLMLADGTAWDCLQDSDGAAVPVWSSIAPVSPTGFVAPLATNPTPEPIPEPIPTPIPPPVTYSEWLDHDIPALRDAYVAKHGQAPSLTDCGHWAWRRFVEPGWTLEKMLADI